MNNYSQRRIVGLILMAALCLAETVPAADFYYTNRTFTAIKFELQGTPPADMLNTESKRLNNIVQGAIKPTSSNAVEKKTAFAWGYTNTMGTGAWSAAANFNSSQSNYSGKLFDNAGWVRGTKSVEGKWGAFLWTMQNHLEFKSSETNKQSYGSGWVMITNVMVRGLTNYPPMSDQTADWPDSADLGLAKSNYPGDNQGESKTFQVDLTTYFQLAIPDISISPQEAMAPVGGGVVQFTAVGTNIENGVAWSIDPSGVTNGATIQSAGNPANVTPGTVPQVYKIRAAVSNCPDFYDEAELAVLKVDIEQVETNVCRSMTSASLNLTADSFLGDGTAIWTSEPAGIYGNGMNISFNPGILPAAMYIVKAHSSLLTNYYDTCIVHVFDAAQSNDVNNPQPDDACTTEPINTISGNNYFHENDLVVPCPGLSLEFVRSYNSVQNREGAFGKGWSHTYEYSLTVITNPFAQPTNEWMVLLTSEGREFKFPKQGATFGPCAENNLKLEPADGGYKVTFPAGVVYTFNTNGILENIKDAWNNQLTLSYTGSNLTQVAHGNGQSLTFTYNGNGRLTNVWAATNMMVDFGYNGQGQMTTATRCVSGQSFQTAYEYNNDSAVIRRTNSRGDAAEYGYTTNLFGVSLKGNNLNVGGYYTHTLVYDSTNKTTVTYTRGNTNQVLEYHYAPETLRLSAVDGPGDKQISYQYGNNVNITSETVSGSSELLTAWRQYDTNRNLTQSAIGYNATPANSWSYSWHETYQLPTLITDPEGNKVGFEYQNGAISRIKAYYAGTDSYDTVFTHATNGLLTEVETPNGATISYTYDAYGHPASMTPSAGPALTFQYSPLGNLERVTWPDSRHIDYESDAQGWVKTITYPDSSTETFAYDGIGNLTNYVDQAGRTNRMTYLPTRKLSSVSRVLDGQTVGITCDYDQQMNTLKIRDALNRPVESYVLDIQNRPVTITNLDGQAMNVAYGVGNFVKTMTRFDGSVVSNAYDGDGRVNAIYYPGETLTFSYFANGLLKTAGDSAGNVSNVYNTLNRIVSSVSQISNFQSQVSYGYYPAGQVSAVTSVVGTVSYSLDSGDRLSSISSPAGIFNYSYNTNNGLIAEVSCATAGLSVAHTYDVLDRLTDITWKNSTNSVVRSFAYSYNAVGMITQKTTTANSLQSTNIYEYDSLDRLISESSFSPQTSAVSLYSYDLVGNRTQMVANGQTINYTLSANRLLSWGTNSQQQFDAAGNATNIQYDDGRNLSLTWNSRYQITEVRTNGTLAEKYQYDALGRRITISDGTTTNYLIYDGIHVIAEVGTSGSLVRSYTYGPGIDNILSMTVYGGTTQTYYYVKDHLGSVQAAVDASGAVVESYKYDAWGNVQGVYDSTGGVLQTSSIGNRFTWQGREYSWKTGLYYFRARWYEPVTGRWLSNDPIGISGGLNQYVFCANTPVNFVDPFGFDIWVSYSGLHMNINVGDPHGNFSSYSFMSIPTFTIFGIGIHLNVLNPWNNGGIVYRDPVHGTPDPDRCLHTSPEEDLQAIQLLDQLVGSHFPYRLIGSTCQDFSIEMFNFFREDMGFGTINTNFRKLLRANQ